MKTFEKVCEIVADRHGRINVENGIKALQQKLAVILEGGASYDIFVRWKEFDPQPAGWGSPLDDGVTLNVRPFCEAGVLCESAKRLNIKWEKDRGSDLLSSPWSSVFHGDCINDHHTTLTEKAAAREQGEER